MSKILKNNTINNITILDTGVTIPGSGQYVIPANDYLLWAASSNIVTYVGSGDIIVNDGSQDLSLSDAMAYIQGYYPHKLIGGTDGSTIGNVADRLKVDADFSSASLPIYPKDTFYQDSFGRSRVSSPHPIFNSLFSIDKEPYKWDEILTGGGQSTWVQNKTCVELSVTNSGDKVVRQTRRSFYYVTGLSKLHLQTFVFSSKKTNLRQRIGAFGPDTGVYLEQVNDSVRLVLRTDVGGISSETVVEQADWNQDPLNGTGPSSINLDLTKIQILAIDLQWLGAGRIRVGFVINGTPVMAHYFYHANLISNVYTRTGRWHLRAEIEALGTISAQSKLMHICSSIIVEGNGVETPGNERTINNGITTRPMSAGNKTIVLALRVKTGFENSSILPTMISLLVTSSNDVLWEVISYATINGGSWVSASSITEVNTTATSISGGLVSLSGYIRNGSQVAAQSIPISQELYLGHDINNVPDTVLIAVTPLASNGNCVAAINYKEVY